MKTIQTLIRVQNFSYYVQCAYFKASNSVKANKDVILAGLVIMAVLVFVDLAAPSVFNNIIHDILTKK